MYLPSSLSKWYSLKGFVILKIKAKVEKGILYVTIPTKKDLENDIEIL